MSPLPGLVESLPDIPTTSVVGYVMSSLRDWRQRRNGLAFERDLVGKKAVLAIFDLEDHRNVSYYFGVNYCVLTIARGEVVPLGGVNRLEHFPGYL